jgi:hypothetical protein
MTFAKPSFDRDDDKFVKHQGCNCAAYGCPLPASMGSHDSHRYCGHHYGKKPGDNDKITFAIKQNLWILDCAHRLLTPELFYKGSRETSTFKIAVDGVIGIVKQHNRSDLLPSKIINRHGVEIDEFKRDRAWAQRLVNTFNKAIEKASHESSEEDYLKAKAPHRSIVSEFASRVVA